MLRLKIAVILFTFFLGFYNQEIIFASHTKDDNNFTIILDTNPLSTDSKEVHFTLSSKQDIFSQSGDIPYGFIADTLDGTCSVSSNTMIGSRGPTVPTITVENPNKLTVSWNLIPGSCTASPSKWKLNIYRGEASNWQNIDEYHYVRDFPFEIFQKGNNLPKLEVIQNNIKAGDPPTPLPKVLLVNARKDTRYLFWWDREWWNYSADISNQDGTVIVIPNEKGTNFRSLGLKKLCMEPFPPGKHMNGNFPADRKCEYSVTFNFIDTTPPINNDRCIISPLSPTSVDDVYVVVQNPKNANYYSAELLKDGSYYAGPVRSLPKTEGLTLLLGKGLPEGNYEAKVTGGGPIETTEICSTPFSVKAKQPSSTGSDASKTCKNVNDPTFDPNINTACTSAAGVFCDPKTGGPGSGGIMTAIGCIPTDPLEFINGVLRFAVGLGGGVALLLMIFGAFTMITSAGNPDGLKNGRQQFTAAIIGLLFVIFATLLLQFIGVDILGIPGFTK